MATYLQGVTDYLPQFQPYQPDLTFYNQVLNTKQTQYDSNYKALNNIYGQYFYADLTHEDNIKRKDELMQNIDFQLKKVSGLDLSLEQNVAQAQQVFKPFYEDQYLMKDMAFTKNYNGQRNKAEGLKNSEDEKKRAMYWETGVRALDYAKDEFKNSNIRDTLGFGSISYTNYVNVQEKALKIAKDADLNIETPSWSPDGRYIVMTKNGKQLEEPLSHLFEAQLGNDPGVQEVYKTQAYVNRKDYAASNAAQFGGDENAAEMHYLETHFTRLKDEQVQRYSRLQDANKVYDNKIRDIESQIAKGNKNPDLQAELDNLKQNKSINQAVLDRSQKDVETTNGGESKTSSTSTGFENPYGDIKSLRWKVDNALASELLNKDLSQAAHVFAYRNAKTSVTADPFAVSAENHKYRMQETALANQGRIKAANIQANAMLQANVEKEQMASGAYMRDSDPNSPTYGRPIPRPDLLYTQLERVNAGDVTAPINTKQVTQRATDQMTQDYALPALNKMVQMLNKYREEGLMTEEQVNQIIGNSGNKKLKGMTLDQFANKIRKNPNYFLSQDLGNQSLTAMNKRFMYALKTNNKVFAYRADIAEYQALGQKLSEYNAFLDTRDKWLKKNTQVVIDGLENQGFKNAKLLYDNGRLKTESEYFDSILKSGGLSEADIQAYQGYKMYLKKNGIEDKAIDKANTILSKIPGLEFLGYGQKLSNLATKIIPKDAYNGFDPKVNPRVAKVLKMFNYDELKNAAAKQWATANIETPVSIGSLGASRQKNTGLYNIGIQTVGVNHLAHDLPGFHSYLGLRQDLDNLDFADLSNVKTSFEGATVTGAKKSDITNAKTRALLQNLSMDFDNGKSKLPNFKIGAQKIAMNNASKGAMIIYPDAEWLKKYVSSSDKDDKLLTTEEAQNILKNGISIISDSKNWNNDLFKKGAMTPLESVIDYEGSYKYEDNFGNGDYTIEKNMYGNGKYKVTLNTYATDPNTGEKIQSRKVGYTDENPDQGIESIQNQFTIFNDVLN
jgi:hypothetical protein